MSRNMQGPYVMARSFSPSGASRPTFQHILRLGWSDQSGKTLCGRDVSRWSRVVTDTPIAILLCKACARRDGVRA